MSIAAQKRGDADISPYLDDLRLQAFLAEIAAILSNIKIDGGDAANGIGDDDFLER